MERSLGFRYFSLSQNADCEEFFCSTLSLAKVVRLVRSTTVASLLHWASMSGCQMYMFIFHVTWSASKFGKTVCVLCWFMPLVLWHCWLGVRNSIRPIKIEWWGVGVVICLEQGADFFACGPADATATPKPHHLLPRLNPDWFLPFCYWLIQAVLEKRPSNGSSSSNSSCVVLVQGVLGTFSLALIAPVNPR